MAGGASAQPGVVSRDGPESPAHLPQQARPVDLIERAYEAAFNLDHDEAIALARRAATADPDNARAQRAVASILWIGILFQRGAVTVDHFMGSLTKSMDSLPPVPPGVAQEFTRVLDRAIALAEARVAANDDDPDAQYDLGAAYAIQASYNASIEGSVTAAFGSARKAFNAQEKVLEIDPSRSAARVVVGTYRYVVSGLSLPSRWFAYIAGFGGGKERGIEMIESALHDPHARMEALSALLLIYTREERHVDALRIARMMSEAYPRNRLFVLEQGAAAVRADKPGEAEQVLTAGIAALDRDPRRRAPGEVALWHYKRAMARIALNQPEPARQDLETARRHRPLEWIRGRIQLEFGKIADLSGDRAKAISAYQEAREIADRNQDPIGGDQARRFIRRPFRLDGEQAPLNYPRQPPVNY
jgi:tetratricopeptide (TPR) repeat protein